MASIIDGGSCPQQGQQEPEQDYCSKHRNCCSWTTVRYWDTSTHPPHWAERQVGTNPNSHLADIHSIDDIVLKLPAWRVLTRGIVEMIDQATMAGYRDELAALATQYTGDQLVREQARFFADRGMMLHQQAVLGMQPDNMAYALERAELLHTAGFDRAAIQVVNRIIEASDDQSPAEQAQLAAALEIGGRSLQTLGRRVGAQKVFARVANLRAAIR